MSTYINAITRKFKDMHESTIANRNPIAYARKLGVQIGERVRIYSDVRSMFSTEPYLIKIGNNVVISGNVQFSCHDGAHLIFRNEYPDIDYTSPISIGDDVFIGYGCIILPGVSIGNRCVIGAGAVVSRDIPNNSVAVGVPAKVIKSTDEYLANLIEKSTHAGGLSRSEQEVYFRKMYNRSI